MEKHRNYYCWVVAYIESAHIGLVEKQLQKSPEYAEVEAYIPTVKVLKKQFKGESHFDEVPLLFNYGFFKIPRKYAIHRDYLDNMQKNISAIFGWVRDPSKRLYSAADTLEENLNDHHISIATTTSAAISELIRASANIGAHSSDDLSMIKSGDLIILRGYPFDGVEAELVSIDEKRQKVKVKISVLWGKEVEVSFDNVFFTIYHNKGYDDTITTRNSLDEMAENKSLDRLTNKIRNRESK